MSKSGEFKTQSPLGLRNGSWEKLAVAGTPQAAARMKIERDNSDF
jgi:hypothetical protein